jgi:hypothetical protein
MSPKLSIRISTSGGSRERVVEYGLLDEERLDENVNSLQKISDIRDALERRGADLNVLQASLAEVVGPVSSKIFFDAFKNWQATKIEF